MVVSSVHGFNSGGSADTGGGQPGYTENTLFISSVNPVRGYV